METRRVLAGRYRLIDQLGQGGMSVVWRARDLVLDREVAVKVLVGDREPPHGGMRTEALAAARLAHPHIASVFDYGEAEGSSGQRVPFVVMELLRGRPLSELDLPLAPAAALRIGAQVAAALAAAHAEGVVHRDVKPGNVMMTADGAKVFDFGLAAPIGAPEGAGRDDLIMGTPAYVAPERITGSTVGTASDIYALGVLLFRLLTGRLPWPVTDPVALATAHAVGAPAPMPEIEGLPAEVAPLYRRCLNRDPEQRPGADEVAQVLAAAAGDAGAEPGVLLRTSAPAAGPDESPGDRSGPTGPTAPIRPHSRRRRGARPVLALGAAGVVVGFILAAVIIRADAHSPDAEAAIAPTTGSTIHSGTQSPPPGPAASGPTPAATGGPAPLPPGQPGPPGSIDPESPLITTGPPPTTASPTFVPPPTTPPDAGPRTFWVEGGTVVASCYGQLAYLLSWTPDPGYMVKKVVQGPAAAASVTYKLTSTQIVATVSCATGQPVITVEHRLVP